MHSDFNDPCQMSSGWGRHEVAPGHADLHLVGQWSEKLPPGVLQLCEDAASSLVLSVVSIWEMQIKVQLGS